MPAHGDVEHLEALGPRGRERERAVHRHVHRLAGHDHRSDARLLSGRERRGGAGRRAACQASLHGGADRVVIRGPGRHRCVHEYGAGDGTRDVGERSPAVGGAQHLVGDRRGQRLPLHPDTAVLAAHPGGERRCRERDRRHVAGPVRGAARHLGAQQEHAEVAVRQPVEDHGRRGDGRGGAVPVTGQAAVGRGEHGVHRVRHGLPVEGDLAVARRDRERRQRRARRCEGPGGGRRVVVPIGGPHRDRDRPAEREACRTRTGTPPPAGSDAPSIVPAASSPNAPVTDHVTERTLPSGSRAVPVTETVWV